MPGDAAFLDHPLVTSRYFFPRPTPLPGAFVVESGGAKLACRLVAPHPDAGTLLHFHGNGETVADYEDMADFFTTLGVNVCFAEYRGYGASTGSPSLTALLDDADAVFLALGLPEGRVCAFGRSLGSIPALELARRRPGLGGLVIESGLADLAERVLFRVRPEEIGATEADLAAEVARWFDHEAKVASYRGPLLVLHTEHDGLIDRSHADRLYARGGSDDKELVVFPLGNHNTILGANLPEYRAKLGAFLRRAGLAPCRSPKR